jgi:ABC-type bacteriocin/lantibiotic exporter with double-glycine peptidase domain
MRKIRKWWVVLAVAVGGGTVAVAAATPITPEPVARAWTWSVGGRYLGRETVRMQEGLWDCGVSAVAMILDAHRRAPELEPLRGKVLGRRRGLSLLEMQEVATERGVASEGWRLDFAALTRMPLPAIAHFDNHYVVVDRIAPSGAVWIRDPAVGRLELPRRSFEKLWTGNVLVFAPPRTR